MTLISAVTCENRAKLVMGCDSLEKWESYKLPEKNDKIFCLDSFLFGASGDSDTISELLRIFENKVPKSIKNVYKKIEDFNNKIKNSDDKVSFLLCGNDRNKLSIYYDGCKEMPTAWCTVGQAELHANNYLADNYRESVVLNEAIYLVLECLNIGENYTGVERPFHIYYFENTSSMPEKLDEKVLQEFQKLVDEKKENLAQLNKKFLQEAKNIEL